MSTAERYIHQTYPFTGVHKTDFDAKVKTADYIMGHFTNKPNYEQVHNVTPGKIYHIESVEGYGDVSDFRFKDDTGAECSLGNFFFELP